MSYSQFKKKIDIVSDLACGKDLDNYTHIHIHMHTCTYIYIYIYIYIYVYIYTWKKIEINITVWKYTKMKKHKVFRVWFIYWIIYQR